MYTSIKYFVKFDLIGGLRINVFSSSVVDRGFDPGVKLNTIKLAFVVSSLITQH
jgi:hypothetical protein